MPAIGYVTRNSDGGFSGNLKTLSIRASVEIGAAWNKVGETSGKDYVSLSLAAPEFGPRKLYANLGRAAGQDDDDAYAVIWNPAD